MLFSFCWILTLLGGRAKDGRTGRRRPPMQRTVLLLPHLRLTHASFKVSHHRLVAQ